MAEEAGLMPRYKMKDIVEALADRDKELKEKIPQEHLEAVLKGEFKVCPSKDNRSPNKEQPVLPHTKERVVIPHDRQKRRKAPIFCKRFMRNIQSCMGYPECCRPDRG